MNKYYIFFKNSDGYYFKLVKSFLFVAFCSSTILLLISSITFLNQINKTTTQYNQAILKNTQVEIQKTVENTMNIARQISISQNVVKYLGSFNETDYMDINEINISLMNIVSSNDYMDSIYVVYPNRNMVITSYGLFSLDSFPDTTWLDTTDRFEWYGIRDIKKDRLADLNVKVITLSMKITKKKINTYVVMNIKQDFIADKMSTHIQSKKGNLLIHDEDGTLISSSEAITQKDFTEIFFPHIKKDSAKMLINIEGNIYIFNKVKSEYNNWTYIAYTPINTIIIQYLSFFLFIILFMLIVIIISYFFALRFGKKAYQPVQSFIDNILDEENNAVFDQYPEFKNCSSNVNSIKQEKEKLLKQIDLIRPSLIDKLFQELLRGEFLDEQKLIALLGSLQIPYPQYKKYIVSSFSIDEYDRQPNALPHEESILYKLAIKNFIDVTCKQNNIFFQCIEQDFKTFSYVFGFIEDTDHAKQTENIIDTIMDFVHKNFDFTLTIGIGLPVNDLISLFISSNQSMEALNQSVIYGNNQIIYFKNIDHEFIGSYINPLIYEKKFTNSIRTFNKCETVQILNDIQSLIRKNRYDIRLIRQFYLSVLNMVFFIEQGMTKQSDSNNKQLNNLAKKIYQKESLHGIHQIVEIACMDICTRVEEYNIQNRKQLVNTIIAYLEANYALDISLNDVAAKVSYTPTYINKILKGSLQKTFYDILTELRINKAKELLIKTDLQIYQIADMIGYSNVQSFIRVFKKVINITPGKYRETVFDEPDRVF